MLSLGKLATGQARYYLEQADGSLSRAASVSSGVEDYYLAGSEAPGVWIGAGAGALGLADKVAALPLDRVLRGEHPATGEPLGRVLAARRPGFDLTFSAPKSVSVLFGVGDDALRAVLRDAHDRAVRDALGYMERHAAVTRRGAGGVHAIAGNGLVAAVFEHRTSRAGDPQLHSHVLVANLTLGADGRWSTLDGRRIYGHAKTAGYLYESRLRSLLTRELGVAWTPVRKGIADISGVPPTVLRAFSRRRAEIEAELERCGAASAAAAEIAALKTRRGKDYRVTPEQLVPEWRERAGALGLTPEMLRELPGRVRSSALDAELVDDIARRLAGPEGLTRERATFTRRDVLRAFSERLPASADLPVTEVERLADDFLRSPRAVVLAEGQRREPLLRADGRVIPSAPAERTYSTPELLELERRILEYAVEREGAFMALARPWAIERAIEGHPSLAGEQAEMVRRLTGDGDGVAIVVGPAGSGKTCALAAAREAWEASGRRVYGAALARRAAHELQDGSGIPSTSVAALLDALQRRPYSTLPRRAVLVLDEAAMIPTRALAELVDHARRLDTKLVLVGDDRQLPAIGAGGAFRGLMARLPVIELQENHRQLAPWERDALRALREGDAPEAVHRYDAAERIVTGDSAPDLRRRLVEDWWKARDPDQAVMIAQRRIDVDELNGRAHALMRAADALGAREVTVAGAGFAVGDRAVVRRNDRKLGVVNGDRGVVVAVHSARGGIELELPRGRVSLPRTYLERPTRHGRPALQHGYAVTTHVAQGATCRKAFILATEQLTREAGYVALSRGRESNRLYALAPSAAEREEYAPTAHQKRDARSALVDGLRRSRAQTLATDDALPPGTAAELAARTRARNDQVRELARARAHRDVLASRPPSRLRPRARARHAVALAQAITREERAASRLDLLTRRLHALGKEVEKHTARPPERAVEPIRPLFHERGRGRDLGLGR